MKESTFEQLRRKAELKFGMTLPGSDDVTCALLAGETLSRETLVSRALKVCLLTYDGFGRDELTRKKAISIALLGVPLWQIFLRMFLRRVAIWVWEELSK